MTVLLIFVLAAGACSSPTVVQEEPFPVSAAQQTGGNTEGAIISVPVMGNGSAFDGIVKRLNESLASLGQCVEFRVDGNNGHNTYFSNVETEMASGNPSCDAYALSIVESMNIFNEGLAMDLTTLLPQYAPVVYAKYKDLLPNKVTGVPAGIYNRPLWIKNALLVRQDIEQQAGSINTLERLFKFIDDVIVSPKQPYTVIAGQDTLVSQWALEQGYYDLGPFGIDGWLYAAINDPACTPVPMESIKGFDEFLSKMMEYYKNGSLSVAGSQQAIAVVKNLCDYYVPITSNWLDWLKGKFTARLLSPDLPGYFSQPLYSNELAIPASCSRDKAIAVMQFMDWLYSDQKNYDTVLVGGEGIDFKVDSGRLAILKDGKAPDLSNSEELNGLFFTWPGFGTLHNSDYYRLPVNAPANIEDLYIEGLKANLQLPLSQSVKIDRNSIITTLKTTDDMKAVCKQRDETLNNLLFGDPIGFSSSKLKTYLFTLAQFKNDWLTGEYARMIKDAMNVSSN